MLLSIHPGALFEETFDGHSLLSLATSTATKSHPNYALIDELNRQMSDAKGNFKVVSPSDSNPIFTPVSSEADDTSRGHLDSNDSGKLLWEDYTDYIPSKKRKALIFETSSDAANLLLHFSRNGSPQPTPEMFAEV
jgi:hypothetical protein